LVESLEEMVASKKISMYLSFSSGITMINLSIAKESQSYQFLAALTSLVSAMGYEIMGMELDGFRMSKCMTVDEFATLYKGWNS
jgi:hypothetical protein